MSKKTWQFYRAFHTDDSEFGTAFGPSDVDYLIIPRSGTVTNWAPIEFEIRPGTYAGAPGDFVNNDFGWRLCSGRLRDLLERHRSKDDNMQWLTAFVTDLGGRREEFFVLHFPAPGDDVLNLDPGETIYHTASGVLIRPCISLSGAKTRRLFNIRGLFISTIVHQSVKRAIEEAGIQGMLFRPIRQR